MPYFEHDGLRFHYQEAGAGLPFIFQHGLGADASQTFDLLTPVPPGVRLLTLECRGHGETRPLGPEEKLGIPQFADDVLAWMDQLRLDRAVVGGISMGAALALHLALTHPERVCGLVLSRPAWLDQRRDAGFELFGMIASLIRQHGAWEGAKRFQESAEFARVMAESPDNAVSLLAQFAHPRADETVAKLERIPQHAPAHSPEDWGGLAVPTLILANRRDVIHPFEFGQDYANCIPDSVFHELTSKTTSKERHAAETRQFIGEFLKRLVADIPGGPAPRGHNAGSAG